MSDAAAPLIARPPGATTPGKLVRFLFAIIGLTCLAGAAALWTAHSIGDAAQTIGRDAEPSVALALRMAATLTDMDAASFSDALTDGAAAIGTARSFRDDVASLATELVDAAHNITYGEAEAAPLRELQAMLLLYQEAVVDARAAAGTGNTWLTSHRLQWASRVVRDMAVPQAEALAAANATELERHYAAYLAASLWLAAGAGIGFCALIALLAVVQFWLFARTHRLLNPPLAAATLIAACGLLWFTLAVLSERDDMRIAKSDAYDSLHVLFAAKSKVNAIRADMSAQLFDPTVEVAAQADIRAAMSALLAQRNPSTEALHRALVLERSGEAGQAAAATPHLGGLLGAELNNITFGLPERQAITESVWLLTDALARVGRSRLAEQQGQHQAALSAWLDPGPDGAASTFDALQAALDRTIAVNQAAFDRHISAALDRAALMPWIVLGVLSAIAALAAGGLWLRLREYY